ncbi:mannose-1-phosphate guanylyltransferase/mannose-6-phosphate isomerase [Sporomusa acidovorans]|uniref:mannose-1-phosphate guanylyltransferase n=1 Tax=Sporomusa acidovorans (strain ATCC 49682 / DSM 3132 / Mol) TaxID=1123286 RepID=A0ABZ3J753_SPOA4|nr:mannose-1-phosphate guanylyltransferase/mannose-6-phosphate isomerase [Sporomusa acidovorans]OZC19390.1 alginate biosynthesis protein AlgA [Sporomusa acidovorans DSM 3132]SDD78374.1 mannose-1-phosphate guanylyltransferase / mannose-6-phosphate isomerase [Sporomusa acidovorans]
MKLIILAGGGGSRLFPLSRTCMPKQFLKLGNSDSLLTQTVKRFLPLIKPDEMLIVTNKEYIHHVKTELTACGAGSAHILLEPVARNTAPAIALATKFCQDELGAGDDEVMFVTPADHIIHPIDIFIKNVRQAADLAAQDRVVTLGVKPDKPETGYGYIQAGQVVGTGYQVASFREKPDRETAEQYLAAENYYWNSGMFAFTCGCITEEFREHAPEIYQLMSASFKEVVNQFDNMPNISIDYAVAEKSARVVMAPLTAYWNDIGSWDAIYDVLDKDYAGNAIKGDCLPLDCANTLMLGGDRLIAGIGLEDVLVVETNDVIVVAKRGESQKVKDVVAELKARGRREVDEHTTMYRPWGSYTVLGEGTGYKLKKIIVTPGQQLSLQLHYHRSEHWIVICGTARVTIGEQQQMVHGNESVYIPPSTKHRLENPGKIPLEIIEVQNGSYLEEDDIVRFDDVYGRA